MISNQKYSFTGSSNYTFNNVEIPTNGIALFNTNTGIGGVDYMPADGDTVTVITGYVDPTSKIESKMFSPDFNNVIYYLVSDIAYGPNDRDTIISLATSVPVTYNMMLAQYEGTFVFSNPNDSEYLYLVFDYTDNLDLGTITYTGSFTDRIVDVDYGTNRGIAGIDYVTTSEPVRYQLYWNNYLIQDTGYIGLNTLGNYNALISLGIDPADINLSFPYNGLVNNGTGSIRFNKFTTLQNAIVAISAPLANTNFTITRVDPALTDFFLDPANGDLTTVCAQVPSTKYRHDGAAALPTIGDRIYVDSGGVTLYDGGNAYHQYNTVAAATGDYILIDSNGVVTNVGTCNCAEIADPVITPAAYVFTLGQIVNVRLEATNNPTSWAIINTCEEYTLDGGTTGTIFNYTDCSSVVKDVTVSIGETVLVCSAAAPTVVGGDGSATLNGVCQSFILPKGLSFDINTGTLSGSINDECDFSFDVEATNCFGTSVTETITISIVSKNNFKPFLIDVENFGNTNTEACAIVSPLYSVLYQNGAGDTPVVGDYIIRTYTNQASAEPFFGGCKWYVVYGTNDVIKVCETGKVCDIYTCP
jgi:hypothetical protein